MWLLLLFDIILQKPLHRYRYIIIPLHHLLKSIEHTVYAFLNGYKERVRSTTLKFYNDFTLLFERQRFKVITLVGREQTKQNEEDLI